MRQGLLYGILASALWALTYVLPLYIPHFHAVEVSCIRYGWYGVISVGMWAIGSQRLADVPGWIFVRCLLFSGTAYLGFYYLHVTAIQYIGAGFSTLVLAFLPVVIAIYGNIVNREYPFRIFWFPLALMSVGIFSIHATDFSFEHEGTLLGTLLGIGCCLVAVGLWAWYAIESARIMRVQEVLGPKEIANLVGLCCLFLSILISIGFVLLAPDSGYLFAGKASDGEVFTFLWVTFVLGIVVSYTTAILWQMAVKVLPVSLVGQILVVEIVLAMLYIYCYEVRFATFWELFGMVAVLGGVSLSIYRVHNHSNSKSASF